MQLVKGIQTWRVLWLTRVPFKLLTLSPHRASPPTPSNCGPSTELLLTRSVISCESFPKCASSFVHTASPLIGFSSKAQTSHPVQENVATIEGKPRFSPSFPWKAEWVPNTKYLAGASHKLIPQHKPVLQNPFNQNKKKLGKGKARWNNIPAPGRQKQVNVSSGPAWSIVNSKQLGLCRSKKLKSQRRAPPCKVTPLPCPVGISGPSLCVQGHGEWGCKAPFCPLHPQAGQVVWYPPGLCHTCQKGKSR